MDREESARSGKRIIADVLDHDRRGNTKLPPGADSAVVGEALRSRRPNRAGPYSEPKRHFRLLGHQRSLTGYSCSFTAGRGRRGGSGWAGVGWGGGDASVPRGWGGGARLS